MNLIIALVVVAVVMLILSGTRSMVAVRRLRARGYQKASNLGPQQA
jgi:uncharacterized membrane protein YhaH (DUF805 family)